MTTPANTHDQVFRVLPQFRLGLLDELAEEECRRHLETCEDCRAALEFLGGDQEDDEADVARDEVHIPESILARWPAQSALLRPAEQTLYREHLATCAVCAGALQLLGHPTGLRVLRRRRFPGGWSARRVLAVLTPVAAAIALVATNPQFLRRTVENRPVVATAPPPVDPRPVKAPPPVETPPTSRPSGTPERGPNSSGVLRVVPAAGRDGIPEVLAARGARSPGSDPDAGLVAATAGGEFVARLAIPAALQGEEGDQAVAAELVSPRGAVLARGSFRVAELFPNRVLSVPLGREAEAGLYLLRLLPQGGVPGQAPDTMIASYSLTPAQPGRRGGE